MAKQFSFERIHSELSSLNQQLQYYTDEDHEFEGSLDEQAHFSLMKAYALISLNKCFALVNHTL